MTLGKKPGGKKAAPDACEQDQARKPLEFLDQKTLDCTNPGTHDELLKQAQNNAQAAKTTTLDAHKAFSAE